MCPPGYETSECGKTCVKCYPGFYKSTWRNDKCTQCPAASSPDTVTLGMTSEDQCFGNIYKMIQSFIDSKVQDSIKQLIVNFIVLQFNAYLNRLDNTMASVCEFKVSWLSHISTDSTFLLKSLTASLTCIRDER